MSENYTGNQMLAGAHATVKRNGIVVAGANKISIKITPNREDVQIGLDIDSKIVSLKGEGTLSINRTYSVMEDVREQICKGKDPRDTIIASLADPDAKDGQIETYQIDNVAWGEFPIDYEKGTYVKGEYPFTFTPSSVICLDEISE